MKIDIFFQTENGFDGHLQIDPVEDNTQIIEEGLKLYQRADQWLLKANCKPRPVPQRGNSGKKNEPMPEKCPNCGADIEIKDWCKKETGQLFHIFKCSRSEEHFKRFKPA